MRNFSRLLIITILFAICFTGCSLTNDVSSWITAPEIGSIFTFRTVAKWTDANSEFETFSLETADIYTDDTIQYAKFINTTTNEESFYITDNENEEMYISTDNEIDESDFLILKSPVEAQSEWEHGTGEYQIVETDKSVLMGNSTERIRDVVEISAQFNNTAGTEIVIQWSVQYGLVNWEEEYDSEHYLISYTKSLISVE